MSAESPMLARNRSKWLGSHAKGNRIADGCGLARFASCDLRGLSEWEEAVVRTRAGRYTASRSNKGLASGLRTKPSRHSNTLASSRGVAGLALSLVNLPFAVPDYHSLSPLVSLIVANSRAARALLARAGSERANCGPVRARRATIWRDKVARGEWKAISRARLGLSVLAHATQIGPVKIRWVF